MNDQLLVRVYNVGFGDCIFLGVPDRFQGDDGQVHEELRCILIDCGSKDLPDDYQGPGHPLKDALDDVYKMLPERIQQGEKKRTLDLLVLTHPHSDHLSGLGPNNLRDIWIERIWLSALMYKKNNQAKKFRALQAVAYRATLSLLQRGLPLGAQLRELWMMRLSNADVIEGLTRSLPSKYGIQPLYMWRDIADLPETQKKLEPEEWQKLQPQLSELQFEDRTTCLKAFQEPGTRLRVLAPEWDIDGEYLSAEAEGYHALVDSYPGDYPMGTEPDDLGRLLELDDRNRARSGAGPGVVPVPQPTNISRSDFRALQSRLAYSALRVTGKEEGIKNNTSVVLLLEWRKRHLLFAGDTQWKEPDVGGWDVMLKQDEELPENKRHLNSPLDFLKVGHHGSINGTPFLEEGTKVLDEILQKGRTKIVLSTPGKPDPSKPRRNLKWSDDLIQALGNRGQVLRTDKAKDLNYPGSQPFCIELAFDPAPGWTP